MSDTQAPWSPWRTPTPRAFTRPQEHALYSSDQATSVDLQDPTQGYAALTVVSGLQNGLTPTEIAAQTVLPECQVLNLYKSVHLLILSLLPEVSMFLGRGDNRFRASAAQLVPLIGTSTASAEELRDKVDQVTETGELLIQQLAENPTNLKLRAMLFSADDGVVNNSAFKPTRPGNLSLARLGAMLVLPSSRNR